MVWQFEKYTYSLSCGEIDEKIDATQATARRHLA